MTETNQTQNQIDLKTAAALLDKKTAIFESGKHDND